MSSPGTQAVSAIKLALMAKQARAEAKAALLADPIAIVGMAARVPGADSAGDLWRLVLAGRDAIGPVPADRWDGEAWFDPDLSAAGKSAARDGGFLGRIDGFDAEYFAIASREADQMDPQQRLFLEVAVEAIDDAGLPHAGLKGSRTGVFVASYHNDYAQKQFADVAGIELRTLTGTLHSVLANRLSFLLDLRGPSLSLDTACSSSLVAVHLACQSLRLGESDVAIAGGVSLMIAPEMMVSLSKVGFMAPDGRCKTFDAAADGFGRGEGCGVIVLKRLSDAIGDRDRVLAVIRGTAVNQDGHSTLLTAPNGPAQEDMIRTALANAQLEPGRIGFVETHGTGTALGDPIEVEALANTIGRIANAGSCWLGSVKANLGHLEAAAGVAGLIKSVLALRHATIPPQPNFKTLNPHISLEGTRLAVPTAPVPWPRGAAPRCAAVSGFGVGGTNAHVVLEEAPALSEGAPVGEGEAPWVLPLSAATPTALRDQLAVWQAFLGTTTEALADICHTAALRRTTYAHRFAVAGRSKAELARRIGEALEAGAANAGRVPDGPHGVRVGFVFCGQGPQWFAMGRELMASAPAYRAEIEACDKTIQAITGWSLIAELGKDEPGSRLGETEIAQPALFAVQAGLVALWRARGLVPAAVCGHSVGEIAALHAASCIDRDEAIRIALHRGRVMQQATGLGRMASVALDEADAQEMVRASGGRLGIGAINGPRSIVLSGETAAVEDAVARLAARGVACRMLQVNYAFHSGQMAPFEAALRDSLRAVAARAPQVPVYSTVTGARLGDDTRIDAAYFGRGIRAPVQFAPAIRAMGADGCDVFLEIGPHPVLATAIADTLEGAANPPRIVASLRRARNEADTIAEATARLHAAGCDLAWGHVLPRAGNVCALPPYPWQRKRHWLPAPASTGKPSGVHSGHPLLGDDVIVAGLGVRVFSGSAMEAAGWLGDHRVFDRVIVPAAAMIEAFEAAAARTLGLASAEITDFAVQQPLAIAASGITRWQIVAKSEAEGRQSLAWYQLEIGAEHPHLIATARAAAPRAADVGGAEPRRAVPPETPADAEAIYAQFGRLGVSFGPAFRCLADVRIGTARATATVALPTAVATDRSAHRLHPVLLDAALQLCSLAAGPAADGEVPQAVYLPMAADRVRIGAGAGGPLLCEAVLMPAASDGTLLADATLRTSDGTVVAAIEGMRFVKASAKSAAHGALGNDLYEIVWDTAGATPAPLERAQRWLVLADDGGTATALAWEIQQRGGTCACIRPDIGGVDAALDAAIPKLGGWPEIIVHAAGLDIAAEPPQSGAVRRDDTAFATLLELVAAIAPRSPAPRLAILTKGARKVAPTDTAMLLSPRAAGLWGLQRVIAIEHPELSARWIDLDPAAAADISGLCAAIAQGEDDAVALRAGQRFVPRLGRLKLPVAAPASSSRAQRLHVAHAGTLDGLELRSVPHRALQPGEVRLAVHASGLNFRDLLLTLGMYPGVEMPLGAECAGRVTEIGPGVTDVSVGDRVMGMVASTLATEVVAHARDLVRIPSGLDAMQAAALPVAFMTAHYGFHHLAKLRPGMSVLVHAGAGGVGMAAIQLAHRAGAIVYATAGSAEKRQLLMRAGVMRAMDSRSLAFVGELMEATQGRGVDVVLNSLAGEFIAASLGVVAKGGCFLELGKRGVMSAAEIAAQRPDVRYHVYDLGVEAAADPGIARRMLGDILEGLADGSLAPLPVTTFSLADTAAAMRHMAQAKHVGKLVITVDAASGNDALCRSDATYLVTGGLGALGLATAGWLVRRGARHLVLTGRKAASAAADEAILAMERAGAEVRVIHADISQRRNIESILGTIAGELPPLRGIVHAAGATRDGILLKQSWADVREVLGGKADGAFYLDALTAGMDLDFFILYSAGAFVLGGAGQGAYAAANAELDALAETRRARGLPALSVAWGAWSGAGLAADLATADPDAWQSRGIGMIAPEAAFTCLEMLLASNCAYAAVLPMTWGKFLAKLPGGAFRSFFDSVRPQTAARATPGEASVADALQALPPLQRRHALIDHLTQRVTGLLDLAPTTHIDPQAALKDIGLDSLTAVELRNALVRSGGRPLPATLLFDYPTLGGLVDHLMKAWGLEAKGKVPAAAKPDARLQAQQIEALSEEEAEQALLQELEAATRGGGA